MSERKVLNKYYPPDYDPSLIPKLRLAKDRQYVIRVMAPFHMRCKTCGNYIYKGTKFNSRKETVQDDDYLGLRIFRFYIKCTRCVAEITFKTDPENQDYKIEHGATRNFEAEKLLEQQEKEIERQKEEDEGNPMKLLEMRTRDSKREMELLENLEELRDLSQRKAKVNYEGMIQQYRETEEERKKRELEEDEEEVKAIFGSKKIRRIEDKDDSDEEVGITHDDDNIPASSLLVSEGPANLSNNKLSLAPGNKEIIKKKAKMLGIVKKKQPCNDSKNTSKTESSDNKTVKSCEISEHGSHSTATQDINKEVQSSKSSEKSKSGAIGGLSLLGSYGSDSDASDSSNEEN